MEISYDPEEFEINGTTLVKWKCYYQVLTVPEGITAIGAKVFYNYTLLTKINLPSSLTTIGEFAFYHCSSLTTINLPPNLKTIKRGAFCSCTSLRRINIPPTVTTIEIPAFPYYSLKTIIIHNPRHKELLKDPDYTGQIILLNNPLLTDTTQRNPKHSTPQSTTQIFK